MAKDAVSQEDVWTARLSDFGVFKVFTPTTWGQKTSNYAWVDAVKQGEARALFTVADLRRSKTDHAETSSPTPLTATVRLVELRALEKKWPTFGGDVIAPTHVLQRRRRLQ